MNYYQVTCPKKGIRWRSYYKVYVRADSKKEAESIVRANGHFVELVHGMKHDPNDRFHAKRKFIN